MQIPPYRKFLSSSIRDFRCSVGVFFADKASSGFASGPVKWLTHYKPKLVKTTALPATQEKNKFEEALQKAVRDLKSLQEKSKGEALEVIEAHLMLLEDPEVLERTFQGIEKGVSASWSYFEVISEFKKMFLEMNDPYMQQRALDLDDISRRVLFYVENPNSKYSSEELLEPSVILAEEITPSQMMSFDRTKVLGLITVSGGAQSHTAILARSMEIPAVMGAGQDLHSLKEGEVVFLEAHEGVFFSSNEDELAKNFFLKKSKFEEQKLKFEKLKGLPTLTRKGKKVSLSANISGPQDIESFYKNDAEGVGLYRTEFLYMDRQSPPSEEEQFHVYQQVFKGLSGKKIIVRTLDIGGDKEVPYLKLPPEENPFLGMRAIRLCLQDRVLFKTQLRALLRAAVGAEWGIMFPMISRLEEIKQAKQILKEVESELSASKVEYSSDYEVGIMVEIPCLAWMMDLVAPEVDFVSLGTNDLLQYTCAVDRMNENLKDVYDPFNPGFLALVKQVVQEARKNNLHVGICGSLSHHPQLLPFFIDIGVQELSMTSQHILPTRQLIREL